MVTRSGEYPGFTAGVKGPREQGDIAHWSLAPRSVVGYHPIVALVQESVSPAANCGDTVRQPFASEKKKQLIVLITPTIIDQAGNRVHNGE